MLRLNSERFLALYSELHFLSAVMLPTEANKISSLSIGDAEREQIGRVIAMLDEMDLPVAKAKAARVRERMTGIESMAAADVHHTFLEMSSRIEDELASRCLLLLTHDEAQLYDDKEPFGPVVASRLPGCINDLEEATKCLALGRGTACVMHLARALELTLHALATKSGIKFRASAEWHEILTAIEQEITQWGYQTAAEVERKDGYRQVHAHLLSVKNAWRHPSMHSRFSATPEIAADIYQAAKGFMRHAAEVLK